MEYLVSGLLLIVAVYSSVSLYLFKKDLNNITIQLKMLQKISTNATLTTNTYDKDICKLLSQFNDILTTNRDHVRNALLNETQMKQAITNVSHDIRTPLTAALGYLQMLEEENLPPEKQQEYTKLVYEKLKSLSTLAEYLFEFTKLTEKPVVSMQKCNLCNLTTEILAGFYNSFEEKKISVQLNIPPNPVYVLGDPNAYKRIVENLVQNVLKYAKDSFVVTLYEEKGEIHFSNKTENASAIDLEHLFDRFYTADMARTKKSTGLGLAIVQSFVQAMGWQIKAQLHEEFLTFIVTFPTLEKE